MSNITIVTAFFDIGRGQWNKTPNGVATPHYIPRTTESYFSFFENLSKVKNDMVIFCDDSNLERIKEIRERNAPEARTVVNSINFQEAIKPLKPYIEQIQRRPEYIGFVNDPRMPEYWNADYVLVNFLKTNFVITALNQGNIKTPLTAWLDFGYVRGESTLPKNLEWNYNFDPAKMHYFAKRPIDMQRPIFDIIRTNDVYIMGCHIVGGNIAWLKHHDLCKGSMKSLIDCGLIDDDQTILLMNYRADPNLFELHSVEVKQEEWNEWNVVMVKYNDLGDKV